MLSFLPVLAQASESSGAAAPAGAGAAAAVASVVLVAGLIGMVIGIGIYILIALVMSKAIKSLPQEAQKCNPVFPWLTIIPLAGVVFLIICLIQIPASFAAHFGANDAETKSAKTIGLVSAIAAGCCIIPLVNFLAAPAFLICLILFLVKVSALGKRAVQAA